MKKLFIIFMIVIKSYSLYAVKGVKYNKIPTSSESSLNLEDYYSTMCQLTKKLKSSTHKKDLKENMTAILNLQEQVEKEPTESKKKARELFKKINKEFLDAANFYQSKMNPSEKKMIDNF